MRGFSNITVSALSFPPTHTPVTMHFACCAWEKHTGPIPALTERSFQNQAENFTLNTAHWISQFRPCHGIDFHHAAWLGLGLATSQVSMSASAVGVSISTLTLLPAQCPNKANCVAANAPVWCPHWSSLLPTPPGRIAPVRWTKRKS